MKNLKIKYKLLAGFLTVCMFAVMIGVTGIIGMNMYNHAGKTLYGRHLLAVDAIGEIRENMQAQRVVLRNFVIYAGDNAMIDATSKALSDSETVMTKLLEAYESTISNDADENYYYQAKKMYQKEFLAIKQDINAAGRINSETALAVLTDPAAGTTVNTIADLFTKAMDNNRQLAEAAVNTNIALHSKMVTIEISLIAVALLISILLAGYISGLICRPLDLFTGFMKNAGQTGNIMLGQDDVDNIAIYSKTKDEIGECIDAVAKFVMRLNNIAGALNVVASGDLTVELSLLSENDTMGISLQKMIDNLDAMFGDINNATMQVSSGSKQVSDGSQTLALGSTEQAAAVEQLSSNISDISGKTKENASLATRASELAGTIRQNAEKGSRQMDQMLEAVKEIQEASKSIGKVIKVIDDIAFQTNILALNAAVEAARAGQHGKGFAVVAEEVRNLAAKSADAAKDTGSLIANSIEKSELGAQIAGETSASLAEIVTGINESGRIVSEIAASSEEQAIAIGQINGGIEQVTQVVQQNSATAQESAAASEEMSVQAHILEELVARFNIKNGATSGGKKPMSLQDVPETLTAGENKYM